MSIERNNAAAAPRGVERSAHVPASGQPTRQRNAPAEAGTSFGALLDSLGSDAGGDPALSLAPAEAALPLDTPTISVPLPGDAVSTAIDTLQLQMQLPDAGPQEAPADALASSPSISGGAVPLPVAAPAQSLAAGGRQPGALQSAGAINGSTRRDGLAASSRGAGQAEPLPESTGSALPTALIDQVARSAQQGAALADTAQSALRATTAQARRVDMLRQLEATALTPAAVRRDADEVPANAATLLLDGLGSGVKTQSGGRDAERKAQPGTSGGATTGLSWLESSVAGGTSAAPASFAVDAGLAAPETAVAEQVHYWVTRGVQSAELQLDAFGGGQVDVHVSVNGNEAQVEFRTDQPEARRMLQDAMPQLRQMLEQEGIVLSGGFVGTSTRQDPGPNGRQSARAPASVKLTASVPAAGTGQALATRATGSTLDVFV